MGVGKTTLGQLLSKSTSMDFLDIDNKIISTIGLEVKDIFKKYGEDYFRKLESNICQNIIPSLKNFIISTGGGVVKNECNVSSLQKNSLIIHLYASVDRIYLNIKNDTTRPLLNNCEDKYLKIKTLLDERIELYKKYSDFSICVNENTVEKNFNNILNFLNLKQII